MIMKDKHKHCDALDKKLTSLATEKTSKAAATPAELLTLPSDEIKTESSRAIICKSIYRLQDQDTYC